MGLIDKELEMAHVIEERRMHFEQFVQEQSVKGNPGMPNAALHSIGHRDSYGPITFESGLMRRGQWVMRASDNPKVLIYTNRDEAENYGKSLLPILKLYGYFFSKVWVEKISVHHAFGHPFSGLMSPSDMFEDDDRYVIRMKVLK